MRLMRAVLVILLSIPGALASRSGPINVLVMHWYDRAYSSNDAFDQALHAALEASEPEGVEYYSEYLETNRFPGEEQAHLLSEYLRQKYAGRRLDAIITGTSQTLDFLLKYRHELFPGVPIAFATERPVSGAVVSEAEAAGFTFGNTYAKTLDLALKWHPGTKQLFVVSGTLNHDNAIESIVRDDLRPYERRVAITYLTDFAPDQLAARIRTLPKDSLILYVWQQVLDAQGRLLEARDVLARVVNEAKVPIYGRSFAMIGRGIVGGYVWTEEGNAAKLAGITMRIVNGTRPKDIPVELGPDVPMFDWRQLQRWGIDEDRLPPSSIIRFRNPTLWQQYRWRIVGYSAVLVLQAVLIGALLVQRKRVQRAQRVLQESEERFRNMADTAPAFIWVLGPDKLCTFVNKPWLDFRGRTMEEELGHGWAEGMHPEDRDRCLATYSSSFVDRRSFQMEYRCRRKDGEYRWLLDSGIPLYREGKFSGYIGSCIDVTDQKRAEAQLRRSLDEIAHLNRVSAMGELTASLAHELNQPLAAILINAQAASRFLSDESSDLAEVRACLADIVADDKRAGEVIRRVRALLRKQKFEATAVDLNDVVSDALQMVRNDALLRQVTIQLESTLSLPRVLGDRVQLYQVVLNLIMNGLEATAKQPPGARWLSVRTAKSSGGTVQLTVEDSGKGIAESDLPRVFERFYTTKPEGLGMGLSISQTIVEAHGGRIWAENGAGRGAIFHCMLPEAQQAAAASAPIS